MAFAESDKYTLIQVFKLNISLYFAPHEADGCEEYLNLHGTIYLTIEQDNRIVGGLGYIIKAQETPATMGFMHPGCSGRTLGKQAVEYCLLNFKK